MNLADQLESKFYIAAMPIVGSEFRAISQQWLQSFCPHVKRNTGHWVYNRYRWHAYSFNHENAIAGIPAFAQYASMPVQPFVLFHESDDLMLDCDSPHWPDIRTLEDDIYIFPRTMEWTFITTHEMSIGLGPYFATPPALNDQIHDP